MFGKDEGGDFVQYTETISKTNQEATTTKYENKRLVRDVMLQLLTPT